MDEPLESQILQLLEVLKQHDEIITTMMRVQLMQKEQIDALTNRINSLTN